MPNHDPRLERELESVERLTADISARFNLLAPDELLGAVEGALRYVVETLDVDRSTIMELAETEDVIEGVHVWARPEVPPLAITDLRALPWLLSVLRRGEVVRIAETERDIPLDAVAEHAYVGQTGQKSALVVPVWIGGRLMCAMAVGTFRHCRDWPEPLVARVRLIAEIIGAALHRRRHELALRESLAEIERLNHRLEAENRLPDRGGQGQPRFQRNRRTKRRLARGTRTGGAGGADRQYRDAARRVRHGEGAVRARHSRPEPARQAAARASQLCGAPRRA